MSRTSAATGTLNRLSSDAFEGNVFDSLNATKRNLVLPASTNFVYDNLLEIGSSYFLEIPATSTLEIEAYVDQAFLSKTLLTAPVGSNVFMSQSATTQNITLPPSTDFLVDNLLEIGVGYNFEIPATSSLEIESNTSRNIGPGQLNLNPQQTFVTTDEGVASTTYTDLATTTDSVTVTVGVNGLLLVGIFAELYNATAGDRAYVSFALSGANTLAASDTYALVNTNGTTFYQWGATHLLTALIPGSTTIKMKYRDDAGTVHAANRRIFAIPL